jgi:hypothetical protein
LLDAFRRFSGGFEPFLDSGVHRSDRLRSPIWPIKVLVLFTCCTLVWPVVFEGPIRRTREGGSEWEPIKILLEGDGDSNKTNMASNTRLRLTSQVGQAHAATWVPLDLGTNKQPSKPKLTNSHSGNLHGLLPVLHQSDRWPTPVRLVTRSDRWTE